HFIDLAPVDNPDFVISSIAHEFGLREKAGEDPLTSLKSYLRDKDLLLILDNFEHVIAAADQIIGILTAARGIKILVTSREKLNRYGEHKFEVQALSLTA